MHKQSIASNRLTCTYGSRLIGDLIGDLTGKLITNQTGQRSLEEGHAFKFSLNCWIFQERTLHRIWFAL